MLCSQPTSARAHAAVSSSQFHTANPIRLSHHKVGYAQHQRHSLAVRASGADKQSAKAPKPYYNKFRSEEAIMRDYVNEWKKTTARDAPLPDMTPVSALAFIPLWVKWYLVPEVVRYLWFCVWTVVKAVHWRAHKWAVLQGAKVDAWLLRRAEGQSAHFSRRRVMERLHFKASPVATFVYRVNLLRGMVPDKEAELATA